jgi:hypothetical protein
MRKGGRGGGRGEERAEEGPGGGEKERPEKKRSGRFPSVSCHGLWWWRKRWRERERERERQREVRQDLQDTINLVESTMVDLQ